MYRDSRNNIYIIQVILVKRLSANTEPSVTYKYAVSVRFHRTCLAKFYTNPPPSSSSSNQCLSDETFERLMQTNYHNKIWNSIESFTIYTAFGGQQLPRRTPVNVSPIDVLAEARHIYNVFLTCNDINCCLQELSV